MAAPAKPKAAAKKKAGKPVYKNYKVSGSNAERLNKFCPKCGEGFMMAEHGNRRSCGKCSYTEIKK